MHFYYLTNMALPQHKNPCPGGHEKLRFHYYWIWPGDDATHVKWRRLPTHSKRSLRWPKNYLCQFLFLFNIQHTYSTSDYEVWKGPVPENASICKGPLPCKKLKDLFSLLIQNNKFFFLHNLNYFCIKIFISTIFYHDTTNWL